MIDFLVVGGGIAGLGAGTHLAKHGSVVLLEQEDTLGYHTSGRSAAMFEENYGPASVVELSRASATPLQRGGYLSPRGFLLIAPAADNALFERDCINLQCAEISANEARDLVPVLNPTYLHRAAYHPEAADLDTDRLMQDWARDLRNHGGEIHCRCGVESIERHSQGWRLTAGTLEIYARYIINAAGAWADEIAVRAGCRPVGLVAKRRSMAQLPAPQGHDPMTWPMIMAAGEAWYAKPQAGKLLVSPADADPTKPHDAWADDMILAEGLARFEEAVEFTVTRLETSWAGLRSFAPDGNPVFGADPSDPHFIWYAGQGGYGFQTAPASAKLISDIITGDETGFDSKLLAALSPARF
ncbi:NAD(P)/FAD-dependent oxidoreductase [Epibacterium ulvae]|uniref:NAD(P)/FAD-dependent oxidoreductase n=1 Tax=Epibacterium ulvae TaxID=1156985 RepID=UPI0024933F18|nr:FAD-dependent oxidoreductase [Epibacterium ulvae]